MFDRAPTTEGFASPVPVVLRGRGAHWPVLQRVQPAALAATYGDRVVDAELREPDGSESTRALPLSEILDELVADGDRRLYLRNTQMSSLDPRLWGSLEGDVRRLNWLLALPVDERPDWFWLMVGGRGTYTPAHVDSGASSAWNLLTHGRKSWRFESPEIARASGLLPPDMALGDVTTSPAQVEFIQEPGDIVITPAGWAHSVRNLTGSVSLTANFINASNIRFAREFFRAVGDTATVDTLDRVAAAFAEPA